MADLLDLVALGTVADLVPLDRNNRILVQEGLRRCRARAACAGLMALARVAGCRQEELSTRQLRPQIAPRLNAAGRIDDMSIGIRCLLTDDSSEAIALAEQLDRLNRDRREMEIRIPQVQAILGFEPVDYQADPDIWRKQLHPEDKDRVLAEVALSHATGEPVVSEYRMFARDGREVWFRDEAWVVRDADGRPLFLQGLMRDVSERRRAEEELRTYKEHLEKVVEVRTAELKKANIRLKQEIAERQKIEEALEKGAEKIKLFAYSVIHDLKNPAIGIYGVASLMLKHYRETLDDRCRKYLEQILKASEHIADLVKKIGVYIITKEVPLNIKTIDLKEILQVVRDEFGGQLEVRRIRWSEPERFPEVQADGLYILRALRNLVDNALKYGGEQLSEIKVGFAETEQFVVLAVTRKTLTPRFISPRMHALA